MLTDEHKQYNITVCCLLFVTFTNYYFLETEVIICFPNNNYHKNTGARTLCTITLDVCPGYTKITQSPNNPGCRQQVFPRRYIYYMCVT